MNLTALLLAVATLAGLSIVSLTPLRAWRDWLELKHRELAAARTSEASAPIAGRIELADLRERVRTLEAIASGIDP